MAGIQGIQQGVEVVRFDVEGNSRQGAGMYFQDRSYIEVVPGPEGPGCDVLWTTTMAGYYAVQAVAKIAEQPIMSGYLTLNEGVAEPEALSKPGGTAGGVVMDVFQKLPNTDLQEAWLHTPQVSIHYIRQLVEKVGATGPYSLLHLRLGNWVVGSTASSSSNGANAQPALREMVLKCIDRTATSSVRANKQKAIDGFALNIPLLRAA